MRYLHTMIRISNPEETLRFFALLGLEEVRRMENEAGRYTLIFLAAPGDEDAQIELTHNWDDEQVALSPGEGGAARGAAPPVHGYGEGRNFGHVAYQVDDVYETCARLMAGGVTINRPPRDGRMAFVRTPDGISIELLQKGANLPVAEPWASMPNTGHW
jgi:lactoylglutathione lyase